MLKSLSELVQMVLQLASPCSIDVGYGACASMHVMMYLKTFILKELVRAQWHSVDAKRTDDDIFIPQIILRSDYFSIKMIDLTWITPTQQWMSEQKKKWANVVTAGIECHLCIKCDHLHGFVVCLEQYVPRGNALWQPHKAHPSWFA